MAKQREKPFAVYLHPDTRRVLTDLELSYGDKRAVVNAAIWSFAKLPTAHQVAAVRSFALIEQGVPVETPEQKLRRLLREVEQLQAITKPSR